MINHKKKTVATWCLAALASTSLALSGAFAFPTTASAAGELASVTPAQLIVPQTGVTVTEKKSVNEKGVTGLAVESEGAYSTELNATFTGDLLLNYIFPGEVGDGGYYKKGDANGAFTFRIEDATDADNYFVIKYANYSSTARVYAEYVKGGTTEIRTFNYSSGDMLNTPPAQWNAYGGTSCAMFNNATAYTNQLKFIWTDGVLAVNTMTGKNVGVERTIVKFDGTDTFNATDGTYGLPKLDFSNGYKISFSSDYDTGTDICFTSIGDINLATTDSIDADVITSTDGYFVNGEAVQNGGVVVLEKGTDLAVSGLTEYSLKGLGTSCGTCKVPAGSGAVAYTGTYNKNVAGEYPLSIGDFTFTVKVVEYMDVADIVSADGCTITNKKTVNDAGVKGLAIESNSAYEGEFNSIFTNDLTLDFIFPGTVGSSGYYQYGDANGAFTFRVEAATNANNYFLIKFANVGNVARVYVEYVKNGATEIRAVNYSSGDMLNTPPAQWNAYGGTSCAMFNNATTAKNQLKFTWADGVLAISTKTGKQVGVERTIVKFDGTDTFNATDGTYGLPKLDFSNGYKISFSSDYAGGTDVCFTSINDVSFNDHDQVEIKGLVSEQVVDKDGNALASGDTVRIFTGQDLGVRAMNTVGIVEIPRTSVLQYSDFAYTSNDLNTSVAGTYTIASVNDPTFTLNVEVVAGNTLQYKVGDDVIDTVYTGLGETVALLPDPAYANGKIFVGWYANSNDGLYAAGANYLVVGDTSFRAVYVDLSMAAGASIRKSEPSGIRFTSMINAADYQAYAVDKELITAMGTLVIPTDLLGSNALTVDGVKGITHLDIERTTWLSDESIANLGIGAEGYKCFAAVMTNVKTGNYARDFAARSYMQISYEDGTTAYFYSDFSKTDNVRSIYEIANKAVAGDDTGVVQNIVNNVANVTITNDGAYAFANANTASTSTVVGSVAANPTAGETFTITVSNPVGVVILNGVEITENEQKITVSGSELAVKGLTVVNTENSATITFTSGNTYAAYNGVDQALKTALSGKTVSIFGDSISTHGTTSVGGNSWYTNATMNVEETWWKQVIDNYGMTLGVNASKGGVGFFDSGAGCTQLEQSEIDKLNLSTTDNDLVMLFLGTNDNDTVSNLSATTTYASIVADADKKAALETATITGDNFAERYYNLLWQVCESECANGGTAKIVMITPFNADCDKKAAIINDLAVGFAARYACDIEVVDLTNSALASSLNGNHDLFDGATSVHPNEEGMDIITTAVIEALKALYAAE